MSLTRRPRFFRSVCAGAGVCPSAALPGRPPATAVAVVQVVVRGAAPLSLGDDVPVPLVVVRLPALDEQLSNTSSQLVEEVGEELRPDGLRLSSDDGAAGQDNQGLRLLTQEPQHCQPLSVRLIGPVELPAPSGRDPPDQAAHHCLTRLRDHDTGQHVATLPEGQDGLIDERDHQTTVPV